jgi:uncharacterized membrane protein ArfB
MGFLIQWVWYLLAFLVGSGVTWLIAVIWLEPIEDDA